MTRFVKLGRRLVRAVQQWIESDGALLAAALAYYAVFSIFPLLMLLTSLLGFAMRLNPIAREQKYDLYAVMAQHVSPGLAENLQASFQQVEQQAGLGGPLGLLGLLFAAIGVFAQFDAAYDRIWHEKPEPSARGLRAILRKVLVERATAFLMLLGIGALIVAVSLSNVILSGVQQFTTQLPGGRWLWFILQTGVSLTLYTLLFTVIHRVFPKSEVHWDEALQGGLLTAILWEVSRQVLTLTIVNQRFTAYGLIGSFIIVLLWIYVASAVIFLGAEYVQVVCSECRPKKAESE